ncbi:hypothetical protein J2S49_000982 [Arcanobacterium wilhelmae]|uniref:Uncharacterized protein n=1 Tax=Arcanobacterium wilhelmae TaxID=1803177 RepID=A0ABT9NB29_9ACTO|nr:hypothetical protein [Arcanobacterium wilhelmae]MDP9800906.1 hypothetical protein [Arcanobacterium wilhelmae]WFN90271.1 hypothetical protein P8A24_08830 [Arcanobacterium wilhelmae]
MAPRAKYGGAIGCAQRNLPIDCFELLPYFDVNKLQGTRFIAQQWRMNFAEFSVAVTLMKR